MNKIKIIITFVAVLMIYSCSTSIGYINDGIDYPPTSMEQIKVYSEKIADADYVEVGYVSANITDNASGDKLKELLKKEAAKMGADAIVSFQLWGTTAEGIAIKYIK